MNKILFIGHRLRNLSYLIDQFSTRFIHPINEVEFEKEYTSSLKTFKKTVKLTYSKS